MRRAGLLVVAALAIGTACGASAGVEAGDAGPADGRPATPTSPETSTDVEPDAPDVSDSTDDAPNPTTEPVEVPTLEWSSCGDGLECSRIEVPADYDDPSVGTFVLPVVRALATNPSERIGSMLVNPGGPGSAGTYLATSARAFFTDRLLERFDIVAWDPRGTGEAQPAVDCIDEYDPVFGNDTTPDDAAEKQLLVDSAAAFVAACAERNGGALAHISTVSTARDMDRIREALGEDEISYFGFSYGSELGATWATMFPTTVRAAALDGGFDPASEDIQRGIDQAKGFEIALDAFLDDCNRNGCSFNGDQDAGAALDAFIASVETTAIPTGAGRPDLNNGIVYQAIVSALYSQSSWERLDLAFDAAIDGDGSGLLALYDEIYQRRADGSYSNLWEAFLAITCLDAPGPDTVAGVDEYNDDFIAAAPRIGPGFTHSYYCVGWPAAREQDVEITGAGAGPIMVIGTTNDPATPFETSLALARALEQGVFVKVTGDGHLGYGQSSCAQDVVDAYLIDLEVAPQDVEC